MALDIADRCPFSVSRPWLVCKSEVSFSRNDRKWEIDGNESVWRALMFQS